MRMPQALRIRSPYLSPALVALLAAGLAGPLAPPAVADGEIVLKANAPHSRMTSEFFHLVDDLTSKDKAARADFLGRKSAERHAPPFRLRGAGLDQIHAYVQLGSWSPEVRSAVSSAVDEVTGEDPERLLLEVWVPLGNVEKLASLEGVLHLRRPAYGIPAAGSVVTEGDTNLGTTYMRSLGRVNGLGIRVGVISDGLFNNEFPSDLAGEIGSNADPRVSTGNIPVRPGGEGEIFTSRFFGNVTISPQTFAFHDIGTDAIPDGAAMLEIVHDLAPGAALFYAGAQTDVQLVTARNNLLNTQVSGEAKFGVDVIVDDLIFYESGRFDGTSTVSRRAQELVLENDVVYVTAAGDYTPPPTQAGLVSTEVQSTRFPLFINGYFSSIRGPSDSRVHNWAEGRSPTAIDSTLLLRPQEGLIDVLLVWDDVYDPQDPRTTDDLDLFLLKPEDLLPGDFPLPDIVRSSTDLQSATGRPVERITVPLDAQFADNNFRLTISRKDQINLSPTPFTLIIFQGVVDASDTQYLTHGIAGNNGDALPPVITVGSLDATQGVRSIVPTSVPGLSPGPGRALNNDFFRWYTTQQTPAVVSYANTLTYSAGATNALGEFEPGPFPGSSAAAAHIGGLVALLRHADRSIASFQFYDILRTTDNGTFPNATPINTDTLAQFQNPPSYLRVNGFDLYSNVLFSPLGRKRKTIVSTYGNTDEVWEESGTVYPFNPALFTKSPIGIEISAGGLENVFGYWQTDLLELPTEEGSSHVLDPKKLYCLTVRVGTDEPDPMKVPHFRLRLTSGGSDESVLKVVAGVHANAEHPPTTIGGKEYKLYYQPANAAVAEQGVRFAFDLVHFNPDDNSGATLFLHEVSFEELDDQ